MYPDEDNNSFIQNFSGTQMSVCDFVTSLTIISQVLQPVLRGLRLLLQPVAVSPAEQVSEGDEAVFPGKHSRSPAQGLEGEKAHFQFGSPQTYTGWTDSATTCMSAGLPEDLA